MFSDSFLHLSKCGVFRCFLYAFESAIPQANRQIHCNDLLHRLCVLINNYLRSNFASRSGAVVQNHFLTTRVMVVAPC